MELAAAAETQPSQSVQHPWSAISRLAFRFCFIYFGLFYAVNTIVYALLSFPKVNVPDWSTSPPLRALIFWVGAHLFGLHPPFVYSGSGSGDKTYDWVFTFCALIFTMSAAESGPSSIAGAPNTPPFRDGTGWACALVLEPSCFPMASSR